MEAFDLVILLGAHVGRNEEGEWDLAPHTKMRARAAGIAVQKHLARRVLVSGGFNVFVRYGEFLNDGVYGPNNPSPERRKSNFSAEAKERARGYPSEASLIRDFIVREYSVPSELFELEEDSSTTEENALRCYAKAQSMFLCKTVGVLTLLYHHRDGAIRLFAEQFAKMNIVPKAVYAEDLLAMGDPATWIPGVCAYYGTPKGKDRLQYDVEMMRQLMADGKSVAETTATKL